MAPLTISIIGGLDADLIMVADRIPNPGESILANKHIEALGGKGANSAVATHRACHKRPVQDEEEADTQRLMEPKNIEKSSTALEKAATNDESEDNIQVKMIGAQLITELNENGIDATGVVTVPNTRSSVCFVTVENGTGENRCIFTKGATATWKKEDFMKPEDLGNGMRPDLVVAQMDIDKDVIETMIETAGKAGIDFCLKAASATPIKEHLYRYLTHLIVNESEAAIMSGQNEEEVDRSTWWIIAQYFLKHGVKNVVITLGANGAFFATMTQSGRCPAYDVKVVDTTGAGDTFTGAYASDYLRQKAQGKWDIMAAVIRSNKAAAKTIQRVGAQTGIPWADEIDKIPRRVKFFETQRSRSAPSQPSIFEWCYSSVRNEKGTPGREKFASVENSLMMPSKR
ncbi:hypothetical protein Hte_004155 [Hypoxylon texense]